MSSADQEFIAWRQVIGAAKTQAELVAAMRRYCETWLPSDWEKLPSDMRPCLVNEPDDIAGLALEYTRQDLFLAGNDLEARLAVGELVRIFQCAAERLRHLRPSASSPITK